MAALRLLAARRIASVSFRAPTRDCRCVRSPIGPAGSDWCLGLRHPGARSGGVLPGDDEISHVPWRPTHAYATLFDPGCSLYRLAKTPRAPTPHHSTVKPHSNKPGFEAQSRSFSIRCLRFVPGSPADDARRTSDCLLPALSGGSGYPPGRYKRFRLLHVILLFRASRGAMRCWGPSPNPSPTPCFRRSGRFQNGGLHLRAPVLPHRLVAGAHLRDIPRATGDFRGIFQRHDHITPVTPSVTARLAAL